METLERHRLTVTGIVQGVGFRPFVYGLAIRYGLTGFVGNNSQGVFIEIEGPAAAIAQFRHTLTHQPPPIAHIDSVTATPLPPIGDTTFTIVHSQGQQASAHTHISPDIGLCADCLRELFDPTNRRYRYPFINCTNCGPRFTIIKDIPYDRPLTTMSDFALCPECQAEYDNPLDRRFHAQPNACPVCGPHLWLETGNPEPFPTAEPALQQAQQLLAAGKIVAVKGIGGFHLACEATNETAVALLRQRKGRVDKPFAVMALDVATVRQFATLSAAEEALLTSKERPILLLHHQPDSYLTPRIAPGQRQIGVMLPYSPLHYLLLTPPSPLPVPVLVMTSANYSHEPIVKDNDAARQQLAPLADALLLHNREIYGRCDDSVFRLSPSPHLPAPLPLRRSRGYTPFPVKLPYAVPPILAVGGELKATFCLAQGRDAYMSQHIGDMENLETWQALETAVNHFQRIFRIQPTIVAADMHPNYLSTRWAQAQAQARAVVLVQHHHAHIASLMAEHGLDGQQPVIGFSFDGTGYGTDGAIWGGEVLLADYKGFQRLAHLKYVPLAGGDVSVKRPYRLALTHLWAAGVAWDESLPPVAACPVAERNVLRHQLETGLNSVPSSSMGRLFDAVAALIGERQVVTYEGQAAMELEACATASQAHVGVTTGYDFTWEGEQLDATAVLRGIVADWQDGMAGAAPPRAVIAAKFHLSVANLITNVSLRIRQQLGFNQVALSGGVFQNMRLLETAVAQLQAHQFHVLTHRLVPANDGGLALGQVMIAATQISRK